MSTHVTQEREEWQVTRRVIRTHCSVDAQGQIKPYQIQHSTTGLGTTLQQALNDFTTHEHRPTPSPAPLPNRPPLSR